MYSIQALFESDLYGVQYFDVFVFRGKLRNLTVLHLIGLRISGTIPTEMYEIIDHCVLCHFFIFPTHIFRTRVSSIFSFLPQRKSSPVDEHELE
jgi:hypothetical protein